MKKTRSYYNSSLLQVRKKLGLTQQQLADELQLSRVSITMIEQGKRSLSTTALLKLATLEMQAQDKRAGDPGDSSSLHPAMASHYAVIKSKRSCSVFMIQEASCRLKGRKLADSLQQMTARYEQLNHWMKLAETMIETAELKKQKQAVQKKLDKCGLAAQGLLRHEISLAEAQASLYCHMQEHIKHEMNKHFPGEP